VFKDDNASRKRGVSLQHIYGKPEYVVLEELLNPEMLLKRNQAVTAESINALLDSLMNSFSISRLKTRLPSRRPKILVWGTSGMYYDLWASFITANPCNYEIMGFIDSDANKWNTQIHELPVNPPEFLRDNQPDIIIIASCFYQSIRERAESLLAEEAETQYIYGSNQLDAQDVIRILQHGDDATPARPTLLSTGTQA
jgi:FlaA1/EpsC-like NDP-sugar epimerase